MGKNTKNTNVKSQAAAKNPGKPKKKKFFSPFRFFLVLALVFYLTYFLYQQFGVKDFWGWVQDVVLVFVVLLLPIALAGIVVFLFRLWKKKRGKGFDSRIIK